MAGDGRHLEWDHLLNARDLGGLPTPDGPTRPGALVRSDSLARLTAGGRAAMLAHGVATMIDVRSPREVAAWPSPVRDHPGYRPLPFMDDAGMAEPSRYETAAENYALWCARHGPQIAAILRGIAEAPAGGVLVHCAAGKDRTGIVVALALSVAGVERAAIGEDFALSSRWDEDVGDQYDVAYEPESEERKRDRRIYAARPENVVQLLAELDRRHGGVDDYLDAIGVGAAVRTRLRDRLR